MIRDGHHNRRWLALGQHVHFPGFQGLEKEVSMRIFRCHGLCVLDFGLISNLKQS